MSQIDAVGSKLKMLERKGQLASSPGMVSGPLPGSSWLPTAEPYHLFYSVDGGKKFLRDLFFRFLGQHVLYSSRCIRGGGVGKKPKSGCFGLRAALASSRWSGIGESDPDRGKWDTKSPF